MFEQRSTIISLTYCEFTGLILLTRFDRYLYHESFGHGSGMRSDCVGYCLSSDHDGFAFSVVNQTC